MNPQEARLSEDLLREAQKTANKLQASDNEEYELRLTLAKTINNLVEAYIKLVWHK